MEASPESNPAPSNVVDTLVVKIDYAIIQHFSEHLYGSPNKAVEELVANSFDAFATATYVYVPGRFVRSCVLVWDNGDSMGLADLHRLWWIAQSPKAATTDRVQDRPGGRRRALIGKFGIGKLASYAVGHRISHLCRQDDNFFLVGVDYRDVPKLSDQDDSQAFYTTPIIRLTNAEALAYVESMMNEPPDAIQALWEQTSWTLAVIDELREGVSLTEGRLRWVLGNGMPLRPDFQVWVNDEAVEPRLGKDAATTWNLSEPKLQQALQSAWKESAKPERAEVSGMPRFLEGTGENEGATVILPELGSVRATIRLFEKSLLENKPEDASRMYGFFVMVRGRLVNPDNDRLFLPDPSYGTFYRCQFVIEADGLDADLLADRERLHGATKRARELAVLQRAIYLAARIEIQRQDNLKKFEQRSESLLPITSREHFRDPLTALQIRRGLEVSQPSEMAMTKIFRRPLGTSGPMANVDVGELSVNGMHPLWVSIQSRLGDGKRAQNFYQILDLFAVSESLLEGHLYDLGLDAPLIDGILSWRDGFFRAMAERFGVVSSEQLVRNARESSYKGGEQFETALAQLFKAMGFEAMRDGISGRKDVLVVAPIGQQDYRFIVEAKGSEWAIKNDDAEVSTAAAHRDAVEGAKFAVIVAREFAGFTRERDETAMILQECRSTRGVSIMTLDALAELLGGIRQFGYPLDLIMPVLTEIENPDDKLARIRSMEKPPADFDFRGVLEAIWQRQQGTAAGDLVSYRSLWQEGPIKWGEANAEAFARRLVGLASLTTLLRVDTTRETVTLLQHPDVVIEGLQRAVDGRRDEGEPAE